MSWGGPFLSDTFSDWKTHLFLFSFLKSDSAQHAPSRNIIVRLSLRS